MNYADTMHRIGNMPHSLRSHYACLLLEALGYRFCVDYGVMNAEGIVEDKGFAEDIDLAAGSVTVAGRDGERE